MRVSVVIACLLASGLGACASYLDDLNQAEKRFVSNEHERALALLRALQDDVGSMSHADRARYYYLRGMNDYRIGKAYRSDARYWLGLARAMERQRPGSLHAEWRARADEALADLSQDVYGGRDGAAAEMPAQDRSGALDKEREVDAGKTENSSSEER